MNRLIPIAAPVEGCRVDGELEPAERQRAITRLQNHPMLVLGGEAQGHSQVVEVGGEPHARIDRIGIPCRLIGQHERIGVHRGGQVVFGLLRPVRVSERQLGQREEPVAAESHARAPQLREDGLRLVLEARGQPAPIQHLRGGRARLSRREHARRQGAVHQLGIAPHDADRRGAGRRQDQRADQDREVARDAVSHRGGWGRRTNSSPPEDTHPY